MQKEKLGNLFKDMKWYEITAACWPLILMFIGGAIGGACGGLACYINLKLFKSGTNQTLKYVFSFLTGIGGIVLYFLSIIILGGIFPDLFKK